MSHPKMGGWIVGLMGDSDAQEMLTELERQGQSPHGPPQSCLPFVNCGVVGLSALMSSEQVPAQYLHKINPVNIPAFGRETHETLHLAEKLLAVDGHWGRENCLLQGYGSW